MTKWIRFRNYWERQWLRGNISVYGLKNRTDNFSEAFNRSFNLLNGKPHQNIWVVLKNLKDKKTDKTDQLSKHVEGLMFTRPPKKINKALDNKIKEATERFDETEDVARFLQLVTYDAQIQTACNQCHLFENDEYNDDIEEFISNDFDENCNFKRKLKPELNRKRKAEDNSDKKRMLTNQKNHEWVEKEKK